MSNPDSIDTGRSLDVLDDDEAIAIMEGRLPPADGPETDAAALAIVRGLLDEPDATPVAGGPGGGGKVVELFARQPWMRMAAALVFGVVLATVFKLPGEPGQGAGLASGNVLYLETVRGVVDTTVPLVTVGSDGYATLITYPGFGAASGVTVHVERAAAAGAPPAAALRADRWLPVLETTAGIGAEDTVVVNVAAAALQPGLHRLRIESRDPAAPARVTHLFRVAR